MAGRGFARWPRRRRAMWDSAVLEYNRADGLCPEDPGGIERADRALRKVFASTRALRADRIGATARLRGLGVLGTAGSILWGSASARPHPGPCSGRAWIESHRTAVHWGWIGRISLSRAA